MTSRRGAPAPLMGLGDIGLRRARCLDPLRRRIEDEGMAPMGNDGRATLL